MRSNPSDMTRSSAASRTPATESPPFEAIEAAASAADHPMPATWPRPRSRPSRPIRLRVSVTRPSAVGSAAPLTWCTLATAARARRMVAGEAPAAWRASR